MASFFRLSTILLTLSNILLVRSEPIWTNTEVIPALQANTTSFAKFTATSYGLDAPHVHPINESAYEWFYFDAVSQDGKYSIVFTFYTAPETGFEGGGPAYDIVPATMNIGTPKDSFFFAERLYAKEAVLKSVGNGASGDWVGTGYKFTGKSDLSQYSIQVDSDDVKGCVEFKAVSPPHYPCGPVRAGQSMEAMPHLAWAVGISDAIAEIDLVVNGTRVKFTGVGYHDKNWGDIPFAVVLQSSVWGHGRLGPFSIVWSETIHRATGKHYTAGYVALNGQVLTYGCTGFKVTPTSSFGAYHVEIDLGKRGVFEYDITEVAVIDGADAAGYARRTGLLAGGIKGEKKYNGVALHEHFSLG